MSDATLNIDRRPDGLWVLRFDHGNANEIGSQQLTELEAFATEVESDAVGGAIVSYSSKRTRSGTAIFVAGANVKERNGWSDDQVIAHVARQRRLLQRIRRLPVFHVTLVTGMALGWGTEWMLVADWRIATPEASFALPETSLGIVPGAGGTADLWAHVGVAQALRLGMTGERVTAEEAVRIGLVDELAADRDLANQRVEALVKAVSKCSPTAVAAYKRAVLDAVGQPPLVRAEIEAAAYAHTVRSGEAAVGRKSFELLDGASKPPWGPRS